MITVQQTYGLDKAPFGRALPPDRLFLSPAMEEALARLHHAVQRQEPAALVGEVGCGKTTLLRAFTRQLDEQQHKVLYLPTAAASPRALLRELARRLHLQPGWLAPEVAEQVRQALLQRYLDQNLLTVLLLDEAQNLSLSALEHLRVLTNFELETQAPLIVLFSAQPYFLDQLKATPYQALNQRLVQRYRLPLLSLEETLAYIRHHLDYAGAPRPLFADEALQRIYHATKGCPRKINRVCSDSLLVGALEKTDLIGETIVNRVIHDLDGML